MDIRVADSRADLDVLVELLEGEFRPDAAERRNGLLAAIALAIGLPLLLFWGTSAGRDSWTLEWLLIFLSLTLVSVAIGLGLFVESRATYVVERLALRRNALIPLASWSVALEEIATIDLNLNGDEATLRITTSSDRQRKFKLRDAAKKKLETLYPEYFGAIDYSALTDVDRIKLRQFHSRLLRKSVIVAVGSVILLAIDIATGSTRTLAPLAEAVIRMIGTVLAGSLVLSIMGAVYFWFQLKLLIHAQGTDERLPVRYRWIFYSVAAVLIVAVAVTMFVLAGKGLVTW